jgi:hypothetical protein
VTQVNNSTITKVWLSLSCIGMSADWKKTTTVTSSEYCAVPPPVTVTHVNNSTVTKVRSFAMTSSNHR